MSGYLFKRRITCCRCPATYRERLALATAGDKGETLRLDGNPCPLHVLLDIPENKENNHMFRILF